MTTFAMKELARVRGENANDMTLDGGLAYLEEDCDAPEFLNLELEN